MNEQLVTKPTLRSVSSPVSPVVPISRRRWMSDHWRWLALAVLVGLVAVAGVAWWSLNDSTAVRYVTVPATRGGVTRTVAATGTVNPELTIIVGSYVSGVIQSLSCDYNSKVKAGQVCATIDPRPFQSVVDQAKANLDVAKAQLNKDKANLIYTKITDERYQWLVARDSASKDIADLAKNTHNQALATVALDEATIEQRQAALDAAKINLGYTNIISPVDGTVVSRNVTQGQTVASSFQTPTLFLIATDLTRMQVDANVSESDIGGITDGDRATFTVDAYPAQLFDGKVAQVRQSPQTVQNVVTYDTVISVPNPDLALKPGMTASTKIVIDQRTDVLRVPNQALRYIPGGVAGSGVPETAVASRDGKLAGAAKQSRVWVLRDGKPVAVPVVAGLDDEYFTEIVKGDLKPGDQVIVSGDRPAASGQSAVPMPRL